LSDEDIEGSFLDSLLGDTGGGPGGPGGPGEPSNGAINIVGDEMDEALSSSTKVNIELSRDLDNNLVGTLIGEVDSVVEDLAINSDAIERLELDDGSVLEASQIQNLISAMAAFTPDESGSVTVTDEAFDNIQTTITTAWS